MANTYRTPDSPRLVLVLSVVLTTAISAFTIVSAYFILTLVQQHKLQTALEREQSVLAHTEAMKANGRFEVCIAEATKITQESSLFNQSQALLDECQDASAKSLLATANKLAEAGQLKLAIETADEVRGNFYILAQSLIQRWSRHILDLAEQSYNNPSGCLNDAITVASAISADNPAYTEAQTKIQQWQEEWQANQNYVRNALIALNTDQPEVTFSELGKVADHPYWRRRIQPIIKAAGIRQQEKRRESLWNEALTAIAHGEEENAISLANQLPDVAPWNQKKADIISQAESSRRKKESTKQALVGVGLLLALWLVKGSSD